MHVNLNNSGASLFA